MNIHVAKDIRMDFGSPLKELIRVWVEVMRHKEEEIIIDISNCRFSGTTFLLGIHLLYRDCINRGYNITIHSECTNKTFQSYLDLTRFHEGFVASAYNVQELRLLLDEFASKTYLPLLHIPATQLEAENRIREKILGFLSDSVQHKLNLAPQVRTAVSYLIDEAVNNITDHARTPTGYLFTQFYPRMHYMDICIADLGVSVLGSYHAVGRTEINSHAEGLGLALNGESTKGDNHRGFGIRTSRNMLVNGLGGNYFIMSGNAFLYALPGRPESIEVFPAGLGIQWNGTYLGLRIPIQQNKEFRVSDYLE